MKKTSAFFHVLALLALAATTGCPGSLQDGWLTDPDSGGATGDAGACPDVPSTVFLTRCATSGCHDASTKAQKLDLQSPGVASRLVGVLSTEGGGWLIDTSDPAASVVYSKLTATPPFGGRMPVGGVLDDATVGCVLAWVTSQATDGGGGPSPEAGGSDGSATSGDAAPPFAPIRVACGQTTGVVDGQGHTWSADQAFTGGTPFVQPKPLAIAKTDSPALYNGQRYGSASDGGAAGFAYSFVVPNGDYVLTLKFAELFATAAGQRQFDIAVGGTTVATNFDIFAAAGAAGTAFDRSFPVHVSSGQLAVAFSPGSVQNPMVDAIEIVAASSGGGADGGADAAGGGTPIVPPLAGATPGTWQSGDLTAAGMTMHYNYLLPYGYSAAHTYPVLMWLHENDMGDGVYNGGDPMGLAGYLDGWFNTADFRSAYPCVVLAPYADQRSDPGGATSNFGGWTPPGDHGPNEDAAVAIAQHFIGSYSVDASRVYVTGASLGGIGSWAMMLDYNAVNGPNGKVFAAAMPFAGVIERYGFGVNPPPDVVTRMQGVPVFAVHGSGDATSQPNWDRAMWQDYGGGGFPGNPGAKSPTGAFVYLEDPGLGHDVWDTYYPLPAGKPMYDWLFAQRAP